MDTMGEVHGGIATRRSATLRLPPATGRDRPAPRGTRWSPQQRPAVPLQGMRPWLGLFLGIAGGALAISLALGLLVVLTASVAHAQAAPHAQAALRVPATGSVLRDLHRLQAHEAAGMILEGPDGPLVAPLQSTEARLVVTANTVRGTLLQRFRNPLDTWLEGTYLFPLPDDAAVDHLRLRVGERVIEGRIREKEAARREFAQARSDGRRATLLEQKRPNAFTASVTNIAPGGWIEIELEFQQVLALRDGKWHLRFPSVVAPRYGSPGPATMEDVVHLRHDEDPAMALAAGDGDMLQPLLPEDAPRLNPLRITVALDPGQPVTRPVSPTHRLAVESGDDATGTRYHLRVIGDGQAELVADRDFVLEWAPVAGALPRASLSHEQHGEAWYGVMVVAPPGMETAPSRRLPREITFVVDTSGSMGGESIRQARAALDVGLRQLQPGDHFNLIQFNNHHSSLFPAPRAATPENLRLAHRYVAGLRADGGTEMRGAVRQALSAPLADGLVGQVVFITDGAIDYEDDLVGLVDNLLGDRRLFTVGIGSAPNGWFMRKAAELGGGSYTFVGSVDEVGERMAALFARIAHPMSTDLAVSLDGGRLAEPVRLPRDLYAGEPLIVTLRFAELPRAVSVSGAQGPGSERWRIPVAMTAAPDSGVHVLWARSRIEALSDEIRRARHTARPQDRLREEVVGLALAHHLVSDYTSLVAVDVTPARAAGEPMRHGEVPANLPAGWDYGRLTGEAERATGAVMARAPSFAQSGGILARTATPAPLQLLLGLGFIVAGFLLLVSRRGSRFLAAGEHR